MVTSKIILASLSLMLVMAACFCAGIWRGANFMRNRVSNALKSFGFLDEDIKCIFKRAFHNGKAE